MKKASTILCFILFLLVILLPLGVGLGACFGYTFALANDLAFAAMTAVAAVAAAVLLGKKHTCIENKTASVLLALAAPFSLINTVFYLLKAPGVFVVVCMLVCICGCCYLAVRYAKPKLLKIISLSLSALMLVPIGFLVFISLIFGNFGQNTVVQSVSSPNGAYYAEVVDSDQGALGGDTLVDVYTNSGINALIFKIAKKPQRVYCGDWGDYKTMDIYWKDDHCLVINDTEHIIN